MKLGRVSSIGIAIAGFGWFLLIFNAGAGRDSSIINFHNLAIAENTINLGYIVFISGFLARCVEELNFGFGNIKTLLLGHSDINRAWKEQQHSVKEQPKAVARPSWGQLKPQIDAEMKADQADS